MIRFFLLRSFRSRSLRRESETDLFMMAVKENSIPSHVSHTDEVLAPHFRVSLQELAHIEVAAVVFVGNLQASQAGSLMPRRTLASLGHTGSPYLIRPSDGIALEPRSAAHLQRLTKNHASGVSCRNLFNSSQVEALHDENVAIYRIADILGAGCDLIVRTRSVLLRPLRLGLSLYGLRQNVAHHNRWLASQAGLSVRFALSMAGFLVRRGWRKIEYPNSDSRLRNS